MDRERRRRRPSRRPRASAASGFLTLALALVAAACPSGSSKDRNSPAYLCPRMLERCRACKDRYPGFDEFNCRGQDGRVLERCRGKAARRPAWIEQLKAALARENCRDFAEGL